MHFFAKRFGSNDFLRTFAIPNENNTFETKKPAEVAQLVEHNLAKVGVASSSLVFRSKKQVSSNADFRFENNTRRGTIIFRSSITMVGFSFFIPTSAHIADIERKETQNAHKHMMQSHNFVVLKRI